MADGRHIRKCCKCYNSPINGPIWTKLGWSHLIMSPTCPPWCGCHGDRPLPSNRALEDEPVNWFRRNLDGKMSFNLWAVYMETVSIVTHVRYQMRSQVLGFWAPKRRMRSTTSFLLHPRPNTGLEETKWFLLFLDVSLDKRPKQWQNVWGFCILHVVLTGQQLCPCSCVRVFHQAYAHLSLYTVLHPYIRSLTHRQEIKMETIDKMEIAF